MEVRERIGQQISSGILFIIFITVVDISFKIVNLKYIFECFFDYLQTDIDNENLVLNHMTNVAIKTHQMTERKLSSLVTGGPPLWITRHRHDSRYSGPSRSQQSRNPQQNVIFTALLINYSFLCIISCLITMMNKFILL